MPGRQRTAIGLVGNDGRVDKARLVGLPGVLEIIPVSRPYKQVSREWREDDTVVPLANGTIIGGREVAVMAGPCSVESEWQIMEAAERVAEAGATILRGGAYKPRTSPYSFQGLGVEGLKLLARAREATGLAIVTEAIDPEGLGAVEEYADIVQIGARNMQNYPLLRRAGRSPRPVLLKRGLAATIKELLLAAEYILSEGNPNVILCERGVRSFDTETRNLFDLTAIPVVQSLSHLPIIADPSHGTGIRDKGNAHGARRGRRRGGRPHRGGPSRSFKGAVGRSPVALPRGVRRNDGAGAGDRRPHRPAADGAARGGAARRCEGLRVSESIAVGRVIGTDPATPLEFWVAVAEGTFLQLDDVVVVERSLPGRDDPIRIYGMVADLRVRHEGARFDSDVFLIEDGVLPAQVTEAAKVLATRFEPEVFVPPVPGQMVRKAVGKERDEALFFDGMERKVPVGLSRDDEVVYANVEFLDGTRGAHVNISGVSGVATKTSYAVFLLHSLFTSGKLGGRRPQHKGADLQRKGRGSALPGQVQPPPRSGTSGALRCAEAPGRALPQRGAVGAAASARSLRRHPAPEAAPTGSPRSSGRWRISAATSCSPSCSPTPEDERQQYTIVVHNVTARLRRDATPLDDGGVRIAGTTCRTFGGLIEAIRERVEDPADQPDWAGRSIGGGTINAFVRRLYAARRDAEHLIRGRCAQPGKHRIAMQEQVTVVDIAKLSRRAQRFVVGVVLRKTFQDKEETGSRKPLLFVVLDELNKYAPRDGRSPIKEILLDMAERGRSLGVILVGAQQTASEVERRVIANSSIRVAGRLDSAEAGRPEYAFLPTAQRQRATILKPGTMILSQPELPVPLVLEFPFPAWATRPDEAGDDDAVGDDETGDPFEGLA